MPIEILQGLAIPFLGTTLGAACVFLLRGELDHRIQKAFTGFEIGRASCRERVFGYV